MNECSDAATTNHDPAKVRHLVLEVEVYTGLDFTPGEEVAVGRTRATGICHGRITGVNHIKTDTEILDEIAAVVSAQPAFLDDIVLAGRVRTILASRR